VSGTVENGARRIDGVHERVQLEEPDRHGNSPSAARLEAAKVHAVVGLGVEFGQDARSQRVQVDPAELARQEEVRLVQRVFMTPGAKARRAVLFAGVEQDNGCAMVCIRAGKTLAHLQRKTVCIVDANLRTPVLHRAVGTDNREGFASAVAQSGFAATFPCRVTPDNLWLLPSGSTTSDPDLVLTAERLRPPMRELCTIFDHLLVYAPPINVFAESLALSQCVDGVVLVLEAHATRREIARNVKIYLEELNIPLLGVVLNNRTFPIPDSVYRLL
jgi:Mrp family chromosome partitioning ATPase